MILNTCMVYLHINFSTEHYDGFKELGQCDQHTTRKKKSHTVNLVNEDFKTGVTYVSKESREMMLEKK